MHNVRTRVAAVADVPEIVSVHLKSFPGFFLSSLGPRFLRLFYRGIVESDRGILLIATTGDEIVGFVGGATEQAGFYGELLRSRGISFVIAGALALVRHPTALPRLARARSRTQDDSESASPTCLMTLGVDPTRQARGIGRSLVQAFQSDLASRNIHTYVLTTDADNNDGTIRFYTSLGLALTRVITTPEGRRLNEYLGEC